MPFFAWLMFRLTSHWKQFRISGSSRIGNDLPVQAHPALDNSVASSQSHLLVGRLIDVSRRPPAPIARAKGTVLGTAQEAVTKADGLFQFTLPPATVPGSEVQIRSEKRRVGKECRSRRSPYH